MMNLLICSFVGCFSAALTSKNVPEDQMLAWECGAEFYSKKFTEKLISAHCPAAKEDINRCCMEHDLCYSSQNGQKVCDSTFCQCLERETAVHPLCNLAHSPIFCAMVEEFGEYAYKLAHPTAQFLLKTAEKIWDEL